MNVHTGIDVRKGSVTPTTCSIMFWTILVPTLLFSSELWVLKSKLDIDYLAAFERYSGRRLQRFPFKSPNATSYRGPGWMKIVPYIKGKN